MPKVSIIVPIYNVEKYLSECLNSLVSQTLKDIEIICINDGSVDNSGEILETYAKNDSRIIIINQENKGMSCARNNGLKNAKGEYIGFIDSDDWIEVDFYEKLYNAAIENNSDICAASIIRKRKHSQKYRILYKKLKNEFELQNKLDVCCIPRCCYVWNKLYKKELIENQLFVENKYFEDVLWLPEIVKKSKKLTVVPNTKYYYRVNKDSVVKQVQNSQKQQDSYSAKKYIIDFYKENNLKLDKKYLKITKAIKYFYNIPLIKTKEINKKERDYLFGSVRLPSFLAKIFEKFFIFSKKILSVSVIDYHFVVYILGFQIRKKIKTSAKNIELNKSGVTEQKRTPKIIASLTTFPARINIVSKTIKTILNQTTKADEVILWLAESQFPNKENDLPAELLKLKEFGLTIKWCNDIKSYKKLIPALKEYKDDIIITFDDDIYYDNDVIECLYESYLKEPDCIHTNRGHRIYIKNNTITPKSNSDVYWNDYSSADYRNTIIGCGGVLYPPNCFGSFVLDEDKFKNIIPTQDDIWFWAMGVLNKRKVKIVKSYSMQIQTVEDSQQTGLCKINKKNDKTCFKKMTENFPELVEIIKNEL